MDNFKRSLLTGSTVICVKGIRATRSDELPKFEFMYFFQPELENSAIFESYIVFLLDLVQFEPFQFFYRQTILVYQILVRIMAIAQGQLTQKDSTAAVPQSTLVIHVAIK